MQIYINAFLILLFTLLSGFADSKGFLHASMVWNKGRFVPIEALKSVLGFIGGAIAYWFAIRYLQQNGIISPEVQTLIWFVVTIVIIAIASNKFIAWPTIDKVVGFLVIVGIAWLLVRVGE